jgi:hypothetical protein
VKYVLNFNGNTRLKETSEQIEDLEEGKRNKGLCTGLIFLSALIIDELM